MHVMVYKPVKFFCKDRAALLTVLRDTLAATQCPIARKLFGQVYCLVTTVAHLTAKPRCAMPAVLCVLHVSRTAYQTNALRLENSIRTLLVKRALLVLLPHRRMPASKHYCTHLIQTLQQTRVDSAIRCRG